MDKNLNSYLEKVEKYLRPMAVSERIDIVKEIQSEMLELQGNGVSPAQILERLGSPKELAKAYLGDSISKSRGFSWRRVSAVIAFYSLAGLGGMFVLPVTGICALAFLVSGLLCPVAGIVKFAAHLMGREIPQIVFNVGSFTANAVQFLPISFLIGCICMAIGALCWKLTVLFIKLMSSGRKMLKS